LTEVGYEHFSMAQMYVSGNTERAVGSASTMATLMLAVFTVSVGFGVVLPLLPYLVERLLGAVRKFPGTPGC
jgi:hypothetical protein